MGSRSGGLNLALGHSPAVAGLGGDPAGPPRSIAIEAATASRAAETLGGNLFRELVPGGPNLVFSPLSASTALRMALVGARGDTECELRAVLGSMSDEEIPKRPVSPGSAGHTEGGPLMIANSLWADSSIQLADTFRRILADSFHAELRKAPFRDHPAAAAKEINSWVAGATRERVGSSSRKAMASIRPLGCSSRTRSRSRRHGRLRSQRRDRTERFRIDEHQGVDVLMMNLPGRFPYAEDGKAQYLEIPFADPRYAFLVILPSEGGSLNELEGKLFEVFDPTPPFRLVESGSSDRSTSLRDPSPVRP